MARSDDLLALAAAHAASQALNTIGDDVKDAEQNLRQSLESGDTAAASVEMRRLADLASQAQLLGQMTGTAPQQPAQSQYTQAEIDVLQRHPSVMNDPRKMAELVGAANALVQRGYNRNSQEYISALETFLGRGDTADSDLTPDGALEIVNNSKFGKISADQYNRGVEALATLKKAGIK
jgi:hypothetical protein